MTRPRGRHPARVYWVRRTLVVCTALALVFAFTKMLGGGGGSSTGGGSQSGTGGSALAAGAHTSPSASSSGSALPYGPVGVTTPAPTGKATGSAPTVALAVPTGPCALNEITVTPTLGTAPAGREVPLTLSLTGMRPACTFAVSPNTLAVRVTSGSNRIWTSQQCPSSIPTETVTVRSAAPTTVTVQWSGRQSDEVCSRSTSWALPGSYDLNAAVIGSEPGDVQFQLVSPPRPVVTKTIKPKAPKTTPTSSAKPTGH